MDNLMEKASTSNALLGILSLKPSYGYEIKNTYDSLFGQNKPILTGQIYSTLARFLRDELVTEAETKEGSKGPDRTCYQITEAGKTQINQWLHTAEVPVPNLRFTLYLKVVFTLLRDEDAAEYLDKQKAAHISKMRELTTEKLTAEQAGKIANVLLFDHAIYHIEADLRWIDMTVARLDEFKKSLLKGELWAQ